MSALPLYMPGPERVAAANLTRFQQSASARSGQALADYDALWAWSNQDSVGFWRLVWEQCGGIGELGATGLVDGQRMPGAQWFPEARLNFAENLLRPEVAATADALVFRGEDRCRRRLSHGELRRQVARCQQALRASGVEAGDTVCGLLPNLPEAVVAMLATVSLGAIWSSASPDFGFQGVMDRFGQIAPKVLFCTDGYHYNGKPIDCQTKNAEISRHLPGLRRTVLVSYLDATPDSSALAVGIGFDDFLASQPEQPLQFNRVPFAHPLFIMFSSGTTGVPKCIVHSHGGSLLQHLKEHQLHADVRPGDRFFYFTTCSWMMWNWLVSALASQATLLLYDGSPFLAGRDGQPGTILFDYAEEEGMTHFGTSAKFIDAIAKQGLSPHQSHDLSALRAVLSTGSPLAPEAFDYVYREVKADVHLASIAGGTDILSCFVGGVPTLPVYRGEIQRPGLGMAVAVFNEAGQPVIGEKGELVCTQPFPSMPIGFWHDADGRKYRAAYFERFDNIWCHGDFAEITAQGGYVIHGRSDATLNPGGVRIGTAEIYRQVEQLPEVLESLVIGQTWGDDTRVVLFVKLKDDFALDADLIARIKQQVRQNTTPRHVPAKVLAVPDMPRTKSGKLVELAVRQVVHGEPVKNQEALANPEALDYFRGRAELAV